jgi:hypothetical protein
MLQVQVLSSLCNWSASYIWNYVEGGCWNCVEGGCWNYVEGGCWNCVVPIIYVILSKLWNFNNGIESVNVIAFDGPTDGPLLSLIYTMAYITKLILTLVLWCFWYESRTWLRYVRHESWTVSDLHFSPNSSRVIKSRRMRWAGHVLRMGDDRCVQDFDGDTWGKESTCKTNM